MALSYRHDVSGVHEAGVWQPSLTYFTPLSLHAAVAFTASADIAEDRYARTYYSISSADSIRSGLPVYDAKGGMKSWTIGLIAFGRARQSPARRPTRRAWHVRDDDRQHRR